MPLLLCLLLLQLHFLLSSIISYLFLNSGPITIKTTVTSPFIVVLYTTVSIVLTAGYTFIPPSIRLSIFLAFLFPPSPSSSCYSFMMSFMTGMTRSTTHFILPQRQISTNIDQVEVSRSSLLLLKIRKRYTDTHKTNNLTLDLSILTSIFLALLPSSPFLSCCPIQNIVDFISWY